MEVNGLLGGDPLGEIFARGDLAEGHVAGQVEDSGGTSSAKTSRRCDEPRPSIKVDDPADLPEVIAGVRGHLLLGELGAGLVPTRRVADECRVVADDDHGRVAQVLKLPELAQGNGVPEVDVMPVGSIPYFTRRGLPVAIERSSFSMNSASGSAFSTPRLRI